ncbi:MAG: ABC transporter permease [Anaerolineales bacterium]|nr:ABC transporter permease [Anaerolineales bacterium]
MKPLKVINIAWQALLKNKIRSLLTMLGIIIGVAAVIIMIAISAGTEATIQEEITGLGSNLIYVTPNMTKLTPGSMQSDGGLVYDDAFAIAEQISGVNGVVVEQSSSQTIKAGDTSLDGVTIMGTTADFPSVRDMEIVSGRYFDQKEVDRTTPIAILGSSLAEELFGDRDPFGETVTVAGNIRLTVVGVFEEKGMVGDVDYDSRLYTPITIVLDKLSDNKFARFKGDRVRTIYVEVDDSVGPDGERSLDDVIYQIELLLAKRHEVTLEEADFVITTQQDIISTKESTTAAFRSLLAWVAGVSLVVGGIGIMNIMLVSVTERTREIGIRQSVGATPNDIRWQFLTEALLLSLIGGLIGVAAGVIGSWLFGQASGMRTVIVATSVLLAFGSAATVGVFFGYYPANKASQLDPIDALRYE